MMAASHAVLAIAGTSIALGTYNPALLSLSAIASLLPDIDSSKSTVGGLLPKLSLWIESRYAHRTITHSWLAIIAVALCTIPLYFIWASAYWAILIGFCLGIAGDALTSSGVEFFYPLPHRVVVIDNYQMRFKTGSRSEFIVMLVLAAVAVVSLNINSDGGAIRAIAQALGRTEGAIDFFNRNAGHHIVLADVLRWRASDRMPINQQYRLISVAGYSFLLQDENGYLYRAGEQTSDVEIIIERIKTKKGAAVINETITVQLQDEPILKRLSHLIADEVFISGTLEVEDYEDLVFPESADIFWPVELVSGGIKLTNAAPSQLRQLDDRYGTGTLTVTLIKAK